MVSLLVKLAVLLGVIAGVSYAVAKTFLGQKQDRILAELKSAREDLAALRAKLDDGELTAQEHDALALEIYRSAQDRGVPLDDTELGLTGDKT